jgi:hypothetical protein
MRTHVGRLARLQHERLHRRRGIPAVPLRLDDRIADLDRPHLVDEGATDLADDEVVVGAVEEEGPNCRSAPTHCATPTENSVG